jgi:hypothetical protein
MTDVAQALALLLSDKEAWSASSIKDVQLRLQSRERNVRSTHSPVVFFATRAFIFAITEKNAPEKSYAPQARYLIESAFDSYRVARRRALLAALEHTRRPLKIIQKLYTAMIK